MCTQTGEQAGDKSADQQEGQIDQYAGNFCNEESDGKLSQIVKEGANYTDQIQEMSL